MKSFRGSFLLVSTGSIVAIAASVGCQSSSSGSSSATDASASGTTGSAGAPGGGSAASGGTGTGSGGREGFGGGASGSGAGTPDASAGNPADSGSVGAVADGAARGPCSGRSPDGAWSPLTVLSVVNPKDHGAKGDGVTDDLNALSATVNALPASGGIVYLPRGASFKKTNLLVITRDHVKFWAPNRQAEIFQSIAGQMRHQAILCRGNTGCGFFGLKLRSDAVARFDALEDNQLSFDHGSLVEVAGNEIEGSAATGMMLYGSTEHYIEGNYIHHTWADHIHHTNAARGSWVWGNFIFNEAPSKGDDGVACVTYGPTSPRCGDMEWWQNTILHTDWGRGYSVIGGDNISIHDNLAIGVAGAGIIVASEGSYNSASSSGITITKNVVTGCGHAIGHPGILVSGENAAADPLSNITLTDNISADNVVGAYRAEGAFSAVTNTGMSTSTSALPNPLPTKADVRMEDTSILRTRDVSHVDAASRSGLYRIHVREAKSGTGFEQRFEYVVKGSESAVSAFVKERAAAGAYLSEQRTVSGTAYALLLSCSPLTLPSGLSGVPFRDLRTGDGTGALSWLWQRLDSGAY